MLIVQALLIIGALRDDGTLIEVAGQPDRTVTHDPS